MALKLGVKVPCGGNTEKPQSEDKGYPARGVDWKS